jgi:PAS domain S-box-containing protein
MTPDIKIQTKKIWNTKELTHEIPYSKEMEQKVNKLLLNLYNAGESYVFLFNLTLGNFLYVSPEIEKVLGYNSSEMSASFFMEKIHEEDQKYFIFFENKAKDFFASLPVDKIVSYKVRYDFRVKKSTGEYIRLLHQVVTLKHREDGIVLLTMGVHTDITHLKKEGIPVLSFIGMGEEPSYTDVAGVVLVENEKSNSLTNRERSILQLLTEGMSSQLIAEKLCISVDTVKTHRKNMMRKAEVSNTTQLIRKAVNRGWC